MDYDLADLDHEWAEAQAHNWIYSEGLAKSPDFTEQEYKNELGVVTRVIEFAMQRLNIHAPESREEW